MEVMAPLPAREGKSLPTMAKGRVEEVINISQRLYPLILPFPVPTPICKALLGTTHQPPSSPPRAPAEEQLSAPIRPIPATSPFPQPTISSR